MTTTFFVRITAVGPNRDDVESYLIEHRGMTAEAVVAFLNRVEEDDRGVVLTADATEEDADTIQTELDERGASTEVDASNAIIGTVRSTDADPIAGIRVRVIRRGEPDLRLGERLTDSDGRYDVRYAPPIDGDETSLVVRALGPDDADVLAESEVIDAPDETETVDLVVELPEPVADSNRPASQGNDVFRFVVARPPESQTTAHIELHSVVGDTDLRRTLGERRDEGDRRGMISAGRSFVTSSAFVGSEDDLTVAVTELDAALATLDLTTATTAELRSTVEGATGRGADALVDTDEFRSDLQRLGDSLLASTIVPKQGADTARLSRSVQLYALLEALTTDDDPEQTGQYAELVDRDIALPEDLFPLPSLSPAEPNPPDQSDSDDGDSSALPDSDGDQTAIRERLARVRAAKDELTFAEFTDAAEEPPRQLETDGGRDRNPPEATSGNFVSTLFSSAERTVRGLRWVVEGSRAGYADSPYVIPEDRVATPAEPDASDVVEPAPRKQTLSPTAIDTLSDDTTATLDALDLQAETTEMTQLFQRLDREEQALEARLLRMTPMNATESVVSVGGQTRSSAAFKDMLAKVSGDATDPADPFVGMVATPQTGWTWDGDTLGRGSPITPLGIADLKVVRQDTKRYELGEVAHVENVLRTESKDRTHRRKQTTDETTVTERETTEESERDLQSTERFEMQREAEKVLREESSRESRSSSSAGTTVSGSYGPVKIDASVGLTSDRASAYQGARESSARTASDYARSVTERTANRIQNRTRDERITRVIDEIEETNVHTLNNTSGTEHVSGIYRWVDKVYRNQVINYGERMMYEFIIPEPAFFYLWARSNPADAPERPVPPTRIGTSGGALLPKHIDGETYQQYAQMYGVADVSPPPQRYVVKGHKEHKTTEEMKSGKEIKLYLSDIIETDDGYTPLKARITITNVSPYRQEFGDFHFPSEGRDLVVIELRGRKLVLEHPDVFRSKVFDIGLDSLRGDGHRGVESGGADIPFTVFADRIRGLAFSIEVLSERTEREYEQWQIDTYNAIMDGYNNLQSKFEEALAASAVGAINITGNNPGRNRDIERDELKRSVVTMLRNEQLDFDAIDDSDATGRPQLDLVAAKDQQEAIQFFEQAFEWEQMAYALYPYAWSRPDAWADKSVLEDPDPLFARFLRAGAARVLVPVRQGYEPDVAHYLTFGTFFRGEGRPTVNDKRYVDIINDIRSRQGVGDGTETVEDEWDVTLPTSLVKLQPDDQLPVFIPDATATTPGTDLAGTE